MKKSFLYDLVVSILAVYQYYLEKVDAYAQEFEKDGLLVYEQLNNLSHEEIFTRLEKAGYRRGNLNAIFTERPMALGSYVHQQGNAHCEAILSSQDQSKIILLLEPIKGVGPKVIANFFALRNLDSEN